jgi:hypothetical protein
MPARPFVFVNVCLSEKSRPLFVL